MDDDALRRLVREREIPEALLEALRSAALVDEADLDRFGEATRRAGMELSPREVAVLRAFGDGGLRKKEAAVVLGISEDTVGRHLRNASAKLGAKNTLHAVALAIRTGRI